MTSPVTMLYVVLIIGLVMIILGSSLSHAQIGKRWSDAWFAFFFGIACVAVGTIAAITTLNFALGH